MVVLPLVPVTPIDRAARRPGRRTPRPRACPSTARAGRARPGPAGRPPRTAARPPGRSGRRPRRARGRVGGELRAVGRAAGQRGVEVAGPHRARVEGDAGHLGSVDACAPGGRSWPSWSATSASVRAWSPRRPRGRADRGGSTRLRGYPSVSLDPQAGRLRAGRRNPQCLQREGHDLLEHGPAVLPPPTPRLGCLQVTATTSRGLSAGAMPMNDMV